MKRTHLSLILALLTAICLLSSCGCKHEWTAATCTTPKTCSLCNEIEGEALGHNWLDATCTAPKSCKNCDATEGSALGHNWQEATTEAPTTCDRCKVTEGSKINVDPRFTTASTKELYGVWSSDVVIPSEMLQMGLEEYFDDLDATLTMEFTKTGDLLCNIELHDYDGFLNALKSYTIDTMYTPYLDQGFTKEDVDAYMVETIGLTVEEYVNEIIDNTDKDELFAGFKSEEVYYVGQNGIYSAMSWMDEFEPSEYTLDGDTLIIDEVTLDEDDEDGEPLVWTKVK
ncbi:MAG: hypothetical protein E7553_03340 [Ruminococcaceae bacterium]|nr:hypothetical protein [Oscillospiraceae bacterium]